MADTSPARQIWAILAPLAALAGLAFLHYRRKGGGKSYFYEHMIFEDFSRPIN